ncbi:MAG: hypothetical protein F9K40_21725 [Kofleriaceae bacterium]|nr:MAG: hypothetical protein F9K40_21725 [Kofleriaceae bacterium]MBZ0233936.1 hypothetical protein [Kofleriaceae bacterium]
MSWSAACALLMAAALAAGAGCKAKEKEEAGGGLRERKDLMTPQEKKRGEDACNAYVTQLCACAAAKPDDAALAERCELKKAKPEALGLLLGVIEDPKSSDDSVLRAHVEARKLIAKCFEEAAGLPAMGCR